jgi:hypothetical protein
MASGSARLIRDPRPQAGLPDTLRLRPTPMIRAAGECSTAHRSRERIDKRILRSDRYDGRL